jgi:hypothetical protein
MLMKNVFFKPWIGEYYDTNKSVFSKKILIVGDSHYGEDNGIDTYDNFTTEVINDYLDPNHSASWKGTFTKFMNSFVKNTKHETCSKNKLWSSVSFYNYLQEFAGNDARLTHEYDYKKDRDILAFCSVLSSLQPEVIISWGNNVWDALPRNLGFGDLSPNNDHSDICFNYPFQEKTIRVVGITHPSGGYKSDFFNSVFVDLMLNE